MWTDELTLVYGDTHDGGYGYFPNENGTNIRIYNLGSWVARNLELVYSPFR